MNDITVTMPIEEYERLKEIEKQHNDDIKLFERCNRMYYEAWKAWHDEKKAKDACMTNALLTKIKEIYC